MTTQVTKTTNHPGVATPELSASERFTTAVLKEFSNNTGGTGMSVTQFQKKLATSYFIKIDSILKDNEKKRLAKKEESRDPLEFSWKNVNMEKLAQDVMSFSSVGLDPLQKNHIFPIPYKNTAKNKYDITFIPGYRGIELKAMKYGLTPPKVRVQVVCANDEFVPLMKDEDNPVETYKFKITKPFDRGEITGGFYYHDYEDKSKNKLRIMNMAAIEKRRPDKASPEFWGGEKVIWKNGKPTNDVEKVEGWLEEMVYKTLHRAGHDDITIDSEKIDEHLVRMLEAENEAIPTTQSEVDNRISNEGNQEFTDFKEVVEEEKKETEKLPAGDEKAVSNSAEAEENGEIKMNF